MWITDNFKYEDFECHDEIQTPYPIDWVKTRLIYLCEDLEVIRQHFNRPIFIHSGYRTSAYNKQIGGARMSQHVEGRAADFTVKGITSTRVQTEVHRLIKDGKLSITGLGRYPTFTHIDIRTSHKVHTWDGYRRHTS